MGNKDVESVGTRKMRGRRRKMEPGVGSVDETHVVRFFFS